jgi:hypothetical protein
MAEFENLGAFFAANKALLKDYLETRITLLKLQSVRTLSRTGGMLVWAVIAIFFLFLILMFAGLVLGFWFTEITGSYLKGFALATLVYIVVFILITLFRKTLFINPMIQKIINKAND